MAARAAFAAAAAVGAVYCVDPDFVYEGNARNKPEPNGPLPKPRKLAEGEEHD